MSRVEEARRWRFQGITVDHVHFPLKETGHELLYADIIGPIIATRE